MNIDIDIDDIDLNKKMNVYIKSMWVRIICKVWNKICWMLTALINNWRLPNNEDSTANEDNLTHKDNLHKTWVSIVKLQ